MKFRMSKYLAFSLLLLAGCSSRPVIHGIPNFALISEGLYRGGQPDANGWIYLRSLGITNVIKLNTGEESDDIAQLLGMSTTNIALPPSTIWQLLDKPARSKLDTIVAELRKPNTYLHCSHGRDRTGLVVAYYRWKVLGWSKEAAESEMLDMGFRKFNYGLWLFWKGLK